VLDTSTSFGPASALTRAPMCTPIPPMSSPRTSHSPVCNPARTWMPSACTASRIAIAQRIARCGPSNIARKPSPEVFTSRPRKRASCERTTAVVRIKQSVPVAVADLRRPARRVHDVGEQHRGQHPIIDQVSPLVGEGTRRFPGRTRASQVRRGGKTLRPGSSTYFAPGMRSATSLPHSGGKKGSSACWRTSVGTRTVGSTARTSVSASRDIMRAAVPGLAPRRS